jgi:hypothetical protein
MVGHLRRCPIGTTFHEINHDGFRRRGATPKGCGCSRGTAAPIQLGRRLILSWAETWGADVEKLTGGLARGSAAHLPLNTAPTGFGKL